MSNLSFAKALCGSLLFGMQPNFEAIAAPARVTLSPQQQAESLIDIRELWAETFIKALVSREIMPGFSDSTFRPNDFVTQSQFDAIANRALGVNIPVGNAPLQRVRRSEAIVFIVRALNLRAGSASLGDFFKDAASIPVVARSAFATAKNQELLFNYPERDLLNPNQNINRAEVASLIYQALAIKGRLPQIKSNDIAKRYLPQNQAIAQAPIIPFPMTVASPPPAIDSELLRQKLQIPIPVIREFSVATKSSTGSPGISLTVPTGFGASFGNAFVSLGYQSRTRVDDGQDAGAAVGVGLGDATNAVGVELVYANFSTGFRSTLFENGGFSFKVHRKLNETTAIAFGVENVITYGIADATASAYGVISSIFQLQDSVETPLSSVGLTLGIGGGRFRSISDINTLQGSVNLFGSVSVRVFEPISIIADWNGQTISLGASIKPFRDIPLVITPGITDFAGNNTNGTIFNGLNGLRFFIGVGYGIYF